MSKPLSIAFIGAGKMASALARGFIGGGIAAADSIVASDVSEQARVAFAREVGARVQPNNRDLARQASTIVLAVKPNQVAGVLAEMRSDLTRDHLVISIAAGISLKAIESALQPGTRVIRVMPNTPALVGACASAYALGESATSEDAQIADRLFASIGSTFEVKEGLLDAVTGLSGSGPAYVFVMIEALSDGGVAAGLPRDAAIRLAAQTVLGAAKMVLDTGLHPAALKDMVASPGGTTIEGLHELEKAGVRGAIMNAVRAAAEKAAQMGRK